MQFGSFVPRRSTDRRPNPPTPDPDATEINPAWSSTLHRHLAAQPTQLPAVGPQTTLPADGIRHPYPPNTQAPQRQIQNPTTPTTSNNDETRVLPAFPMIARPNRPAQAMYPTPTPLQVQYANPTDIGAQIHRTESLAPYQGSRELEYYGDPNIRNIMVVAGYQVHAAYPQGVLITENGPNTRRTLIPWHRVHNLRYAPGDPLLDNLNNNHSY